LLAVAGVVLAARGVLGAALVFRPRWMHSLPPWKWMSRSHSCFLRI